jgi:hypothetical protein
MAVWIESSSGLGKGFGKLAVEAAMVSGRGVTVTGTPYTVLGSFSAIFTCCVFSVFTFR